MLFRKVHIIKTSWRIATGKRTIKVIPKFLEELGAYSSLIVCGENTFKFAGRKVEKILRKSGMETDHIFVKSPDFLNVKMAEKKAKAKRAQVLIGVGGGKNIDVAKTVAFKLKVPYLSVPTIPSHDGIASPCSSIFKERKKLSLFLEPPAGIVVDISYLRKTPVRFFSSGAGDVIAKYTAVTDWELARERKNEYYGEYAGKISSLAASVIIENASRYKEDYESSIRLLIEALISCGYAMSIAGSSRPCSGSEHSFAHAIDFLYPENQSLHGEKVALGTLIMSYIQGKDYELIRKTMEILNLPKNYREIKIPEEILVNALIKARKIRKRYTILDEVKIENKSEAEKILKKLKII
ncbi:MAG: iron-containing alcohol dehydrogenase [Candidatus Aenigmatarchaeota archaeon]